MGFISINFQRLQQQYNFKGTMKFIEESASQTQLASDTQISHENLKDTTAQVQKKKKVSDGNSKIVNRWTHEENLLYIRFLKQNSERLSKQSKKKFSKFQKMSFYIESKSADQCRSHHQKMMIRFKNIDNIVEGLLPKRTVQVPKVKIEQQMAQIEIKNFEYPEISTIQMEQNKSFEQFKEVVPMSLVMEEDVFSVLF